MKRRDALKATGIILGTTIIGANAFLTGCTKTNTFKLNENDLTLLNDFAETLLPETNIPGAREANVAGFMNTLVADFYSNKEQNVFLSGIKHIADLSNSKYNDDFISLSEEYKTALLMELENEAQKHYDAKNKGPHYYIMFKQLTIWGYMSSEVVAKNAFIHSPLVEKYIGSIDYTPGDKIVYNDFGRSGSARSLAMHHINQ